MLHRVDVGRWSLAGYEGIVPDDILAELRTCAAELRGARVLHLSATPYGGGVSELLRSAVPLMCDLGIEADWRVISGQPRFFAVTKAIHNGLQGDGGALDADARATYLTTAEVNAAELDESYDAVIVHDPQPAGILAARGKRGERWIWRCHIDTSEPNSEVWGFLRPLLESYDAAVFTMADFVPPDLPVPRTEIIAPAIDPLSPKNLPLPTETATQILDWIGVDLDGPLITQVSRFDLWKDPLGAIAAYRLARERVPDIQLALVGSMALDDPEGWSVYRRLVEETRDDPRAHVFSNATGVGNTEVNAFQRLSDVIVQKSIREGFGLVVSESLWKGTPVVAGRAGGIPMQMPDGSGGILVDDVERCADAIVRLVEDRPLARRLGELGRERVREHFLLPRLLRDELTLVRSVLGAG